jgi:hypothetical protein
MEWVWQREKWFRDPKFYDLVLLLARYIRERWSLK